jgi:hypothetical protein
MLRAGFLAFEAPLRWRIRDFLSKIAPLNAKRHRFDAKTSWGLVFSRFLSDPAKRSERIVRAPGASRHLNFGHGPAEGGVPSIGWKQGRQPLCEATSGRRRLQQRHPPRAMPSLEFNNLWPNFIKSDEPVPGFNNLTGNCSYPDIQQANTEFTKVRTEINIRAHFSNKSAQGSQNERRANRRQRDRCTSHAIGMWHPRS